MLEPRPFPRTALAQVCAIAEGFGRHLGLAFQIVDDILDLTASSSILGKPALNDIKSGLATVPVRSGSRRGECTCVGEGEMERQAGGGFLVVCTRAGRAVIAGVLL